MAYGQQTMGVFLGSLWPSISVGWASMRPTPGTGGNSRRLSLIQYFRYVRDFKSSLATQTTHTVVYWVILRSTAIHILFMGLASFPGSSQSTKVRNETTRSSINIQLTIQWCPFGQKWHQPLLCTSPGALDTWLGCKASTLCLGCVWRAKGRRKEDACEGCKREGVHVEGLKGGGGREDWYKHESKYASFVTTGSGVVSLKHKCVHFSSDLLVSQPHPLVILEGHKMHT